MPTRREEAPGRAVTEVEIRPEILERIEEIPDAGAKPSGRTWTAEEDEIIRRYYTVKNKEQLAELLGVTYYKLKQRYRELTSTAET